MRYDTINYDTQRYDFVALIRELLAVDNLEEVDEKHDDLFRVGSDSSTSFHQKFYDSYRAGWPEMVDAYESLIADVIKPTLKESFLYQKFPTFRVHLRNNLAVGAFHTDAEFGHPKGEINYIVPITNSGGNASVWIESLPGLKDFDPVQMVVGDIIRFNGNELTHGNHVNDTGATRVSMDFRVLPLSRYHESDVSESVTRKTKFKEGEYYKRFQ